nr:hypothetical protein GCM10020092_062200 [Actinoplanes digitatis]
MQTDGNPYTEVLNRKHKYVASRGALPWVNSSRLEGEVTAAVAALKREVAGDLVVLGSGVLVRALAAAGLVDVYWLSIHPLVLGTGTRLFADGAAAYRRLRLTGSVVTTTTGVIIAAYRPTRLREGCTRHRSVGRLRIVRGSCTVVCTCRWAIGDVRRGRTDGPGHRPDGAADQAGRPAAAAASGPGDRAGDRRVGDPRVRLEDQQDGARAGSVQGA